MAMEPRRFYRVQSGLSFTDYDEQDGFSAKAQYLVDYSHWLNKAKIESHLDWWDRSWQSTPFISVFDNYEDARRRARFLEERNHRNVFVAGITVPRPRSAVLEIGFRDEAVRLPTLLHEDQNGSTRFISTVDVREHLRVDVSISQQSEWFALSSIPGTMITQIGRFS